MLCLFFIVIPNANLPFIPNVCRLFVRQQMSMAFANGGQHGGDQDSWKLVHFIRHLPHLTAEERAEMERYNPKGPDDRAEEQKENDFLNGPAPKAKPELKDHHVE